MRKRGCRVLDQPSVSLKHSSTSHDGKETEHRLNLKHTREVGLGLSVDVTKIFTIFCVEPLVSV